MEGGPWWRAASQRADVPCVAAMLKLREDAVFSDYVQPICLPDDDAGLDNETFLGIKCVATGWGMRIHGARLENRLKEVWVPVVNNSHCFKIYGMMHNIPVKDYHVCAGFTHGNGGQGTCIVSTSSRGAAPTPRLASYGCGAGLLSDCSCLACILLQVQWHYSARAISLKECL